MIAALRAGASSRIVAQDERDTGLRQVLNLGHTVGHAIETATGYARYRHGEAVGLGLLAALRLAGPMSCAPRCASCWPSTACRRRSSGVDLDAVMLRDRARQEAHRTRGPCRSCCATAPGRAEPGQVVAPGRAARRRAGVGRVMSVGRDRIEVMHGVNLDQLGRRDPGALRLAARLTELERRIGAVRGASSASSVRFFHTNHEGEFVEHLHGLEGHGRRDRAQSRRLDPLLVRDPGRAGDRRAAGGRGAPVRCRAARGVAAPLGDRASSASARVAGKGVDGYRDALRAAAEGAGRMSARARAAASRRCDGAGVDLLLVTGLVNVRYLTGYTAATDSRSSGTGRARS